MIVEYLNELDGQNRPYRLCNEFEFPEQQDKAATDVADAFAVVMTKVSNGLEVRGQAPG